MVTEIEHRIRLAIEAVLPTELAIAVRRIDAHLGWGNALFVDLHTIARREVNAFRDEIHSAITMATGETRIVVNILEGCVPSPNLGL